MTNWLAGFTLTAEGENYRLRLTTDNAGDFELLASADQLDELAEEIDRHLDVDLADEPVVLPPPLSGS